MDIKKQAVDEILSVLRKQVAELGYEQYRNISEINKLSDKQRVLKKKKYELSKIINQLENKP